MFDDDAASLEVPEIADNITEIKRVVREPGYRTKMAVISQDPKIDCIGACVGGRHPKPGSTRTNGSPSISRRPIASRPSWRPAMR